MHITDGVLRRHPVKRVGRQKRLRDQLVLLRADRRGKMEECHDSLMGCHLGFDKTYERIKERFWWPKMYSDIRHWVETCLSCGSRKGSERKLE